MKLDFSHKLEEKQKKEYLERLDRAQRTLDLLGSQTETLVHIFYDVKKYVLYLAIGIGLLSFALGFVIGKLI